MLLFQNPSTCTNFELERHSELCLILLVKPVSINSLPPFLHHISPRSRNWNPPPLRGFVETYFFFNLDIWALRIECLPKKCWESWQIWRFKIQDGRQNQVHLIYLPRYHLFYIRARIQKLQHTNLYAHTKFR